ncbi:MAG: type IV pilus modification PilV family protein [Patescibacteria group bacterium]|jgi:type II secretory pathway pseudopilin PulG
MRAMRGFGLLEVVLAMGIVALVLGSVIGVLRMATRRSDLAARRVSAMYLAQESLEQARALRDSAAQDGRNNRWTELFGASSASGRFSHESDPVIGNRWMFRQQASETIQLDGVSYVRTTTVGPLPEEYATQLGLNASAVQQLGRRVEAHVKWGEAAGESVRAATYLMDWRPGS